MLFCVASDTDWQRAGVKTTVPQHLIIRGLIKRNGAANRFMFEGDRYETLAVCRSLELARAAFAAAIEEKPAGRFMIRSRTRVVKRHPEGDW